MEQLTLTNQELEKKLTTIRGIFEEYEQVKIKTLDKKEISYGIAYIYDPYFYEFDDRQVGLLFIHTDDVVNVYYLFTEKYRNIKKNDLYFYPKLRFDKFDKKWLATLEEEENLKEEWLSNNSFLRKTEEMSKEMNKTLSYLKKVINN